MGELHDKDYYNKKSKRQKTYDRYLNILHKPMSSSEVAEELGVEEKNARIALKQMEELGLVRVYILNNMGKKGYIRRIDL